MNKKPEVRRLELILAAKELFEKKGYANTSVEAIIQKVGVAKGTFYYYFKSKKDILSALTQHIGDEMIKILKNIADDKHLNAVDKLKQMLVGPQKKSISELFIMDLLHKPDNRELQEQLNILTIQHIAPLIAQVLEQGNQEGVFNIKNPVETIQIILAGSQFVLDSGLFEWDQKKRLLLLATLQTMFEQLSGVRQGTLSFITEIEAENRGSHD